MAPDRTCFDCVRPYHSACVRYSIGSGIDGMMSIRKFAYPLVSLLVQRSD